MGCIYTNVHYLDSQSNTIKRARHVYSATLVDKLSPGGILRRYENAPPPVTTDKKDTSDDDVSPVLKDSASVPLASLPSDVPSPIFDTNVLNFHLAQSPSPFVDNNTHTYKVDLSHSKTRPFGIFVQYDKHFGLPLVKEILPPSPWYINLPAKFRRNMWILGVNNTEPITP